MVKSIILPKYKVLICWLPADFVCKHWWF